MIASIQEAPVHCLCEECGQPLGDVAVLIRSNVGSYWRCTKCHEGAESDAR